MEFGGLGSHCAVSSCNQQDFLPFKCEKCTNTYCLEHRSFDAHSCSAHADINVMPQCPVCQKFLIKPVDQLPDLVVEQHIANGCKGSILDEEGKSDKNSKCSYKACKKSEVIPLACKNCRKVFCVSHRHAEDHKCEGFSATSGTRLGSTKTNAGSKNAAPTSNSSKPTRPSGREILAAAQKKVGAKPSSSSAVRAAPSRSGKNDSFLNRAQLKFKAVGDAGVGVNDRVYFDVVLRSGVLSDKKSIAVWLNKTHTVSRAIEVILRLAKVRRLSGSDDKTGLLLCKEETTELSRSSTLVELIESGMIQDGDKLILRC